MRAIFLDRDGVICKNRSDHVKSWQEFEFLPEAKRSLVALSQLGLPIVVVTNQAVVNRGLASASAIEDIHRRMVAEITDAGGRIDRVIYCPHRPEDKCACRKPEPGMLLQAAAEMDIDLASSYFVGDAATDLMAARKVGCRAFLVLTGRGVQQLAPALRSVGNQFAISRDLMGAATDIINAEFTSVNERMFGISLPSIISSPAWINAAPEK
jgi:D-glycero-D-manno-heptose 1,7-bisphosphate phosphatase